MRILRIAFYLFSPGIFMLTFIPSLGQNKASTVIGSSPHRTNNLCGVTAIIQPGNDSVITTNTAVLFTSASINATSYTFVIDNVPSAPNTPVSVNFPVGLSEIKLVAYNGTCSDTAVCYYFYAGTFPPDIKNTKLYYGFAHYNQGATGIISCSTGG